ncbi:HD domain-containing protein [Coniophora puteana RWD-64-598 SS2]|uniref:5'-deoxynucleotidase n=1 Tax=Coniophora puteana (strain RWD-64-598) TaxID=741705 RepID=A0A5M3MIC9_CONPW|nr:HD domain-containing protein [Coniophora puteana RWD-64-598 SS2]EIW78999.1 HD domain-containing protein [Coniophora puteana RWD-64-598 SS2]
MNTTGTGVGASTGSEAKRVFPPLYVASGNASTDRLAFFHIIERLKTQKRTGWVDNGIPNAESISDHMYRMALLAMCTSDENLDVSKCVMMAVVHDLAEAQVGDIAPREGISKAEKRRLEAEAMHNFVYDMLHGSSAALRIEALWKEYEEGQSAEAKFVKDLDRLEMAIQASEYEKAHDKNLQPFFDSSVPFLRHPEVQEWGKSLTQERDERQSQGKEGQPR